MALSESNTSGDFGATRARPVGCAGERGADRPELRPHQARRWPK